MLMRMRWAAREARESAQTVKALIFSALVGAGSGFAASQSRHPSVLLVLGAALLGVLAPLILVFIWAFLTLPTRGLQYRVTELEGTVETLQARMNEFFEEKHGDPFQFLPIYHELRADVREAVRTLERARSSGKLWGRTDAPECGNWKKRKDEIATSPWAKLDGLHGDLLEAFDHLERLNASTALRFGAGRRVKVSDDLDVALATLGTAESRLTFSIDRLEDLQRPAELWDGDDA
jgi:hypothetical protein